MLNTQEEEKERTQLQQQQQEHQQYQQQQQHQQQQQQQCDSIKHVSRVATPPTAQHTSSKREKVKEVVYA